MKGFDCATPVGGIVAKIADAGCGFVGRYYSRNPRKNLSAAEARALGAAGIGVVSVWEAQGDNPLAFTAAQGRADALLAAEQAATVGQPPGSVIYFAVDYDALLADILGRITPYFTAAGSVLAGHWRVGVYGSGLVCQTLKPALASHAWLGGAMGWAGSRSYTAWDIKQGIPGDPYGFGFQVDPDESQGDDPGIWFPAGRTAAIADDSDVVRAVKLLQGVLDAEGYYKGAIDGDFGPQSRDALAAYYTDNPGG